MIIGNRKGMNYARAALTANRYDTNNNGRISLKELHRGNIASRKMDSNHDGLLQVRELAHSLSRGDVFINTKTQTIKLFSHHNHPHPHKSPHHNHPHKPHHPHRIQLPKLVIKL